MRREVEGELVQCSRSLEHCLWNIFLGVCVCVCEHVPLRLTLCPWSQEYFIPGMDGSILTYKEYIITAAWLSAGWEGGRFWDDSLHFEYALTWGQSKVLGVTCQLRKEPRSFAKESQWLFFQN